MDKQQIKQRLREAVEQAPHRQTIRSVALFGSCIHGTARRDSDIDVLVDFAPEATIGFFELFDIQHHFESCLGRAVDLVTPQGISRFFRDRVLAEAEYVYQGR